ncbi:g9011 [Coccomyxa elongata]
MIQAPARVPTWAILTILAAISCGAYFNTLQAGFTYDDFFAVIKNTDVTDDDKPVWELLFNDFWGQAIKMPTSHKSYRPLTVWSLRLQHHFGNAILKWIGWEKVYRLHDSSGDDLDPLPFHVSNVFLHAVVTCLLYMLAIRLCMARDSLVFPMVTARSSGPHRDGDAAASDDATQLSNGRKKKSGAKSGVRQRRSIAHAEHLGSDTSGQRASRGSRLRSWSSQQQAEAFLAATFFAVHPIHTEAVAGIVGQAELICAAYSIVAVLLYAEAADLWISSSAGCTQEGDMSWMEMRHWAMVVGAMLCVWAAALAKEIGITVTATVVLYDAFLVPFDRVQPPSGAKGSLAERVWRQLCTRKGARIIAAGLTLVLYVKFRSFLAVDQLVRIYRKVENPVAFMDGLPKLLSLAHLHGQYAALMVAPVQLCADWSYRCIEMVERLSDWRNLLGAVTYTWLTAMLLLGRPWEVILEGLYGPAKVVARGSSISLEAAGAEGEVAPMSGQEAALARRRRRWRSFVAMGLIVAPFLPASNVFFWVGTYIGERLLYAPSIGYCILLADMVAWLAGDALPSILQLWRESPGHLKDERLNERRRMGLREWGAALLVALLLLWYSWRTIDRNWDWEDEERLFRSALKVCPNSAKVQLNMGITERRYYNWNAALEHFEAAYALSTPGFCEPLYWLGVTRINAGHDISHGAQELEDSLSCVHTATDAATALNKIYTTMQEKAPEGGLFLKRWAKVLLRPELRHIESACDALEQALLGQAGAPTPTDKVIAITMQPCMDYLDNPVNHTEAAVADGLAELRVCLEARAVLMSVLSRNNLTSLPAKAATYSYISQFGAACRYQHLPPEHIRSAIRKARAAGQPPPEVPAPDASQGHVYLVHRVHTADPNDGWLQREWGEVLVSEGRLADAAVHFEVAGKQMVKLIPHLVHANHTMGIDAESGHVGELTAEQVAMAATTAFDRAVQAKTEHPCRVYHQMCEVQAVLSEVCTARGQPQKAREHMETAERCMAAVAAMHVCQSYVQQLAAMQAGMKPDVNVR